MVLILVTQEQRHSHHVQRLSGWRAVLVLAAVCSLTLTVATRYCSADGLTGGPSHNVRTQGGQPNVQRLVPVKYDTAGLPRVERLAFVAASSFHPRTTVDALPAPTVHVADALANRAPPTLLS